MLDLPVPTTLEMAQEQILQLQEEHTRLTNDNTTLTDTLESERQTYTTEINERDSRITQLREHNQKLFLRASAAIIDNDPEPNNAPEPERLEDFARSMKGVF